METTIKTYRRFLDQGELKMEAINSLEILALLGNVNAVVIRVCFSTISDKIN